MGPGGTADIALPGNSLPRYLPHMENPEVLNMGLAPMVQDRWIETDSDIGRYHRHKLQQRATRGDEVYRSLPESLDAQRELRDLLCAHLLQQPGQPYRRQADQLHCAPGDFSTPFDGSEPLWISSLWVADDLLLMQKVDGAYHLTAASLCCPSHWSLADKFGCSLREIHGPIPGFHQTLSPKIDRFFDHLRPEVPVTRYNWSLQSHDGLADPPGISREIAADTSLYYRTERQALVRLPQSGAVVFSIRVYCHPLQLLAQFDDAIAALFAAVDSTPPALAGYKGFDRLAPALEKYRR